MDELKELEIKRANILGVIRNKLEHIDDFDTVEEIKFHLKDCKDTFGEYDRISNEIMCILFDKIKQSSMSIPSMSEFKGISSGMKTRKDDKK